MRILIDTNIWSLALRRRQGALSNAEQAAVIRWRGLVNDGNALLLGLVRQEVLSGIRHLEQFEKLRNQLREWPDLTPTVEDYEQAARFSNTCRAAGLIGSPVDILLCAVAARIGVEIFTLDTDFVRFSACLPIRLFIAGNDAPSPR